MACADEWLMNLAPILAQQGKFIKLFGEINIILVAHILLHLKSMT